MATDPGQRSGFLGSLSGRTILLCVVIALVAAIVALSRPLGLKVMADGVETAAQKEFLAGIGVDEIQGQIAGPPMLAAAATQYLMGPGAAR